jgi:hypothetical protein
MMLTKTMFNISPLALVLAVHACSSASKQRSRESPINPPSPRPALTAEQCEESAEQILSRKAMKAYLSAPQEIRNTALRIALAVSAGKLDEVCLDYSYIDEPSSEQ